VQPFPDESSRWQAVLQRDPAADGAFCYAVRSTGIYCRPTCPSRRPAREKVRFFDSPAAAEQAGFRPCRRCRPEAGAAPQAQQVARLCRLLEAAETPPSLAELGAAVGLSPTYVQRLFKRATGLSPKAYAAAHRAQRLKAELRQGAAVAEAQYEAGYGSARALYEGAARYLGMSPGAYRSGGKGQRIAYALADSPLGRLLIAATPKGICSVRFGEDDALVAELQAEFPHAELTQEWAAVEPYARAILEYLAGESRSLALPTDAPGTPFQHAVWAALKAIPYGQTRSYSQVAEAIGRPEAVRAVARACATNPVALVVPCHRVVGKGGSLSGYRWGLERKRALLEHER